MVLELVEVELLGTPNGGAGGASNFDVVIVVAGLLDSTVAWGESLAVMSKTPFVLPACFPRADDQVRYDTSIEAATAKAWSLLKRNQPYTATIPLGSWRAYRDGQAI